MANKHSSRSHTDDEQSLLSHLIELRSRLLKAVVFVLLVFGGLASYSNQIYNLISKPLVAHLPETSTMVATGVTSPFLTPFKLTLVAAIFISMPVVLYQLWAFVAPGLYKHEKRMALPLLVFSIFLFYAGVAFAYYVVFPLVFTFLSAAAPNGVAVIPDISAYLDFVLTIFFAFGIAFQVPIATIVVISTGMISRRELSKMRSYVIVAAFVIGMFLTPPDVISQTLLAIPIWLLFEIGLLFSWFFTSQKKVTTDHELNDNT
ncbi:MAG TPA: twin-arginine translocase subunit TatC [Crenotrichaceae bacterium]|nr:twin-arginine translocase subunit TatC [Crenotrichaceae bacterium]